MARYSIPDMHCGKCKTKIEDAVLDADEGALIDFDMDQREIDVDTTLGTKAVAEVIKAAGYDVVALG